MYVYTIHYFSVLMDFFSFSIHTSRIYMKLQNLGIPLTFRTESCLLSVFDKYIKGNLKTQIHTTARIKGSSIRSLKSVFLQADTATLCHIISYSPSFFIYILCQMQRSFHTTPHHKAVQK